MTQHITQEQVDTKEKMAVGAFLSAMHDQGLDGAEVRKAMLELLGLALPASAPAAVSGPNASDLIAASSYASSLGFMSGTSNWAAAMQRHLAGVAPAAVSGWPCEIISGDFVENTLTIEMKCDDYRISAGRFYLTAAPTGEPS